ncbi:hypothetical protein PoB_001692100 [Plakobranchus ocellatus]|uniref:Uncharacterized protein n=1 Tax=Plakobranchus ocellatus TaxID=259542 RepID=A0AAV3Z737_9GAST|nr:hypothetical protein PoB_001692100 [Plakobranchus ocellatus]
MTVPKTPVKERKVKKGEKISGAHNLPGRRSMRGGLGPADDKQDHNGLPTAAIAVNGRPGRYLEDIAEVSLAPFMLFSTLAKGDNPQRTFKGQVSIRELFHTYKVISTSVAQWLTSPAWDLQGPFCRGFEPRHGRPGLTKA